MSKATVLRCDVCTVWDSKDVRVRTVTVTGPKFDLCTGCRVDILVALNVELPKARAYHELVDAKIAKNGALPPLSRAVVPTVETDPELPLEEADPPPDANVHLGGGALLNLPLKREEGPLASVVESSPAVEEAVSKPVRKTKQS